jgi:hypothetical protein
LVVNVIDRPLGRFEAIGPEVEAPTWSLTDGDDVGQSASPMIPIR